MRRKLLVLRLCVPCLVPTGTPGQLARHQQQARAVQTVMDYSDKGQESTRCSCLPRTLVTVSLLAAVLLWLVAAVAVDVCSMDPKSFSGCMEITRATSWPLPARAFEECRNDELRAVCLTSYELRAGCITSFALVHLCQAVVVLAAAYVAVGATRCATVHAATCRERPQGTTTGWSTIGRDSTDDHAAPPSRDSVSLEMVAPNEIIPSTVTSGPTTMISRDSFYNSHGMDGDYRHARESVEELLPSWM